MKPSLLERVFEYVETSCVNYDEFTAQARRDAAAIYIRSLDSFQLLELISNVLEVR